MERRGEGFPLITVIVPVYNIYEYLPRCVESLCAQTYPNLEILLVDDGSTDQTGQLCDELAAKDARIRVFHKENGGSSSARNYGLTRAKGDYIGFVDSDDYVEPDMYALLYDAIARNHVKAAQVGRDEIDPQGVKLANICEPPEREEYIPEDVFLQELLMHRGDCSFCTKLLEASLYREGEGMRFPIGELNEDFNLLVHSLKKIGPIVSLPKQCYHVFYRVGSNSRKADKESFSRVYADNVTNADRVMKLVQKEYPKLLAVAFRFGIFQRIDYLLHIPISQMRKDNEVYRGIVRYMRRNWCRALRNSILTKKDKLYHTLFALAPKIIRSVHRKLRG